MIRVLLADDQATVRGALAALLQLEKDIEVVAEVGRSDEVLKAALKLKPDVALLDIEMPGGDGLSAANQLREKLPSCRVLMLTTFGRPGLPSAGDGRGSGWLSHKGHSGGQSRFCDPPSHGRRAHYRSSACD